MGGRAHPVRRREQQPIREPLQHVADYADEFRAHGRVDTLQGLVLSLDAYEKLMKYLERNKDVVEGCEQELAVSNEMVQLLPQKSKLAHGRQ